MNHPPQVLELELAKPLRRAITAGHPWVYRQALRTVPPAPPGSWVRLRDRRGFVAWGVYDPEGPIAVRVWSRDPERPPDADLVRERLARAWSWRRRWLPWERCEAWRIVHGEADGLPGWAIDRYREVWVVRSDGAAAAARLPLLVATLVEAADRYGVEAIVHRRPRRSGEGAEVVWGEPPELPFVAREYDWWMEVDPLAGQKTGWFLDQRENRRLVGELAVGKRVLNLFAYTGGFGLAAAAGGAVAVTNVDVSAPALAAAERNVRHSGFDPDRFRFVVADAFAWLGRPHRGQPYDLIVLDPPSFAPNARSVPRALAAYERLFVGALARLAPGGLVAIGSCSSHVDATALLTRFAAVARTARRPDWRLLAHRGAAPDHPTHPAFPEGAYLDFLVVEVG